jgi:hypothetical protein
MIIFFSEYFGFPLSVSFHRCSIIIIIIIIIIIATADATDALQPWRLIVQPYEEEEEEDYDIFLLFHFNGAPVK